MAVKNVPRIGDNRMVSLIISLAVTLISIRYITSSALINFIWLPYGTLGIAFSIFLPFLIAFFFIEGFDSFIVRKVGWSGMAVIFTGLMYTRWDDLSTGSEWYQNLAWFYFFIILLSVLLIAFDKNIRAWMLESSLDKVTDRRKRVEAAELTEEIKELQTRLSNATDHTSRKAISDEINEKRKSLRELLRS